MWIFKVGINTMAVWKCKPTADFPYFIYQSTCASVHCEQLDWLFIWNAKCYFVLPYVSSVIFLTLYSVCMFLLPNWHFEVIMNCRMCQIFCSFVFWLHHGSSYASQCWRQSFIHDFFPRNPFCSSNWTLLDHQQQQLRKRANNFAILIGFETATVSGIIAACTVKPNKRFKFIINE